MAIMNPLQRRRFEEIIRQNPGALAQLIGARGADLGGLAGMGGAPVNLAQIAGLAPQPEETVVSPAQPAPVAEGAPVAAPALPPARPMGPGYRADGAAQQAMNTPEAILGAARMQAAQMSDEAARAAVVPAEVEAVLGKREKRYAEQLAEVEEDKKKAGWEALAMAGFRMAQSQSPYFMSALATGMEAGLNGFNAGKAARAEKKARLQTAEEDVVLDRIREKQAAEQRAREEQARVLGIQNTLIGQSEAADKLAEFRKLAPYRERTAAAQAAEAEVMPEVRRAQVVNYLNPPQGGGGGGSGLPTGYASLRNSIVSQMRMQQGILSDVTRIREHEGARAALIQLEAQLQGLDSQVGAVPSGSPLGGGSIISAVPVVDGRPQRQAPRQQPEAAAPAAAPAAKPAAKAPPKAELTPAQREAAVNKAIRQANAEYNQYKKLDPYSTPGMRIFGEKADVRKAANQAVAEAKASGLPQYRKRPDENYTQYDGRIRRMLNLPRVD